MIHAELSEGAVNPKLLPKDHHFIWLVIQDVHEKLCHAGVSHIVRGLEMGHMHPSHIPAAMLFSDSPCKY